MSTLKVNAIVSQAADSAPTIAGLQYPTAGSLSNRNLIINGAMQVAQRGTSVTSVTTTNYRTADRFEIGCTNAGTWTVSEDTDAPEGFSKSIKMDCTTANASLAGTALLYVAQKIEGQNLQHLEYGNANAKELTFSLYFKSNKTGIYNIEMFQQDASRSISFDMNVTQTGWQRYEFQIPGDTAGTIDDDNGLGWWIVVWLGAGPDFSGGTRNTTWNTSTTANRLNSSQVNLADNTDNECYLTGFQLELGSEATPFEHRSYGDELARCQRYFYRWDSTQDSDVVCDANVWGTSQVLGNIFFPQSMRVGPDFTASAISDFYFSANSANWTFTEFIRNRTTTDSMQLYGEGPVSPAAGAWTLANGVGGFIRDSESHPSFLEFDAEL